MIAFLWLVVGEVALVAGLAALLSRFLSRWSPLRVAFVSASVPVLAALALWLWVFIGVRRSAAQDACGVDACGMALGFATIIAILTGIIAFGAFTVALWIARMIRE